MKRTCGGLLTFAFCAMLALSNLTMDMHEPEGYLDDYGVARWVSYQN